MTDEQREFNGRMILELCELGDRILASYGIGPERAKASNVIPFPASRNAEVIRQSLDRDFRDAANIRAYDANEE